MKYVWLSRLLIFSSVYVRKSAENCPKTLILAVFGKFISVKCHIEPMSISEDIGMLTMIHLPIFPMEPLYMDPLKSPLWRLGATLPSTLPLDSINCI